MIKEYYFEICDDNDLNVEYDIIGEEYEKLIETCFKYSKYFSFNFRKSDTSPADIISDSEICPYFTFEKKKILHECGITFSEFLPKAYMKEQYDAYMTRKYYLCNRSTKNYLINLGSVFEYLWKSIDNKEGCPEDLVFYRMDDTVLFSVITHEGECFLYTKNNENFEDLLKNPQWRLRK